MEAPHPLFAVLEAAVVTSLPSEAREEISRFLELRNPQPLTAGKRRIMRAVLTVLVRDGAAALSMRAIARESALKPASIYSHFQGGKDELVSRTILWSYVDFLALVMANTDGSASARDQFEHVTSTHIDFQLTYGLAGLGEATLDTDRAVSHLTEEAQQSLSELRGLYRNYVIALIAQLGGTVDAASKGAIIVNLLDNMAPRSSLMNEFPNRAAMKDFVVGASLGIIHSKRVNAPRTMVPGPDAKEA